MEKLNFEQIKEIIESEIFRDNDLGPVQWFYGEMGYPLEDGGTAELIELIEKLGKFKIEEQFGGEGKGDEYWVVYYFKDHNVYIQFDGWYASYHGSEYSEMFEVRPEEVTRIEYVRV